jgi:D-glycero-D-manno-heptose 1,7-bisphosphate phosphatase
MKIAFLDRDGVINRDVHYLSKIHDFEYVDRSKEALRLLRANAYEIVIVTNQAGIGRGLVTPEEYRDLTNFYLDDLRRCGVSILDVYHCPHHPEASIEGYRKVCVNRKPQPGMIKDAMLKYEVNPEQSFLVGDKVSDVEAGLAAGINSVFLVETGHTLEETVYNKYVVLKDLYQVTEVVLRRND